jgi:hypothetical protein
VEPASISDPDEAAVSQSAAQQLRLRALRLEYATLAWNVVGSVIILAAAVAAYSVALAGFGLDFADRDPRLARRRLATPGHRRGPA